MDYRRRAERFRALASQTSDPSLQASYEALARSYDELPEYLETKARSQPARQASQLAETWSEDAVERRLH
jgi:hypothetical protein